MPQLKKKILDLIKQEDPINPLAFAHDIIKDYAHEKLCDYISSCQDCSICTQKSFPEGNTRADLMIILESSIGSPKAFQSFYLLEKLYNHYNVNQDYIYYINSVNCYPQKVIEDRIIHRPPSKEEVNNCKVFLEYAIDIVKPKAIVLMGAVALNVFKKESISKARGTFIDIKGIKAMPTYHPDYFLHSQGKKHPDLIEEDKADFCDDFKKVLLYINDNFQYQNLIGAMIK